MQNTQEIVKLIAGLTLEQWAEVRDELDKKYGIEVSMYFYRNSEDKVIHE